MMTFPVNTYTLKNEKNRGNAYEFEI